MLLCGKNGLLDQLVNFLVNKGAAEINHGAG